VLGNPPYVRMEYLKALKPYLAKRFEVVSDRADLYAYFFERGIKLLKPGGRMGYISSSTFFKTGSGAPLRNFLRAQATLETIVDFGDHQVFEGVTTYPAILTMRAGAPDAKHQIRFWNIDDLPADNFDKAFAGAAQPYPQASLSSGSWELENPALRALRDKIKAGNPTLKEVYGSPLYGIKTGLNEAFVIDTSTMEKLCREDPRSAELLKPFLEGKDLKRWRAEPRGLWIIYIPKNRIKIDDYPAVRDWLLPFKGRLEARATQQEWFELQQAQEAYLPVFQLQKIAYIDMAMSPSFALDSGGSFYANTAYFIDSQDMFLLGVLNCPLSWFVWSGQATMARGGVRRLFTQHVETLPIPPATDDQKAALATLAESAQSAAEKRYSLQQEITRRIPDLAPSGNPAKLTERLKSWWDLPDFAAFRAEVKKAFKADIPLKERTELDNWISETRQQIHALTAEITALEADINTRVYALFGLTPDEITLLESSL
jgi:TaqI-like C-terminal specificity domain/Eco57I restriction-modification methylase